MEFNYRVSEDEFKQAFRLRLKSGRSNAGKTVLFWIFILICLIFLWSVVQRSSSSSNSSANVPVAHSSEGHSDHVGIGRALMVNVGPFLLLLAVWFLALRNRQAAPATLGSYNRDPLMQGVFTANITQASVSIQNTAGYSVQMNWYLFESWREERTVILLLLKSGGCTILSTNDLSDPQKSELRGILSAALPQR